MLHFEKRIFAQTPSEQGINSRANKLYSSIYSTSEVIIQNKDALYENSLRAVLPGEQHTTSYLLVVDRSHIHESKDFSSHVQAEMATTTSEQLTTVNSIPYNNNQIIYSTPTLGNYGHTVWQRKQSLSAGHDIYIWIYQEEPANPEYLLNTPCTVCKEQLSQSDIITSCNSPCCQSRTHSTCISESNANTRSKKQKSSKWKCPNCKLDDQTYPQQKFCGTQVADWFLYQLVRDNDVGGFLLQGVTHDFLYSQYFDSSTPVTLQERQFFTICRGSQLCFTLLKRLEQCTLSQLEIAQDYSPIFYIDNCKSTSRHACWFSTIDFLDDYLWEPLQPFPISDVPISTVARWGLAEGSIRPGRLFQQEEKH
jgi:hypothetical protein